MRNFFIILIVAFMTFSFTLENAYAKRFGGGRSFGVQRSVGANNFGRMNNAASSMRTQGNRWLGPLMGLAVGGILASLFMSNGFGTGLMSWLLLGGLALLLYSVFKRRQPLSHSSSYQSQHPYTARMEQAESPFSRASAYQNTASGFTQTLPNGMSEEDFLRQAKVTFLRMQVAYDQKNTDDIRTFTTPQVFAEVQMQLAERGNALNQTEVSNLNAELVNVDREQNDVLVSVLFTGLVKENPNEPSVAFRETWHFQAQGREAWIVAGIQQD